MLTIAPVVGPLPLADPDADPVPIEPSVFCRRCKDPSSSPLRAILTLRIAIATLQSDDGFKLWGNGRCGNDRA